MWYKTPYAYRIEIAGINETVSEGRELRYLVQKSLSPKMHYAL